MLYRTENYLRVFNSYSWDNVKSDWVVRTTVRELRDMGNCLFIDITEINQTLLNVLEKNWQEKLRPQRDQKGGWMHHYFRWPVIDAIEDSSLVILWWSRQAVTSRWIHWELDVIDSVKIPVLIVRLDDAPLPWSLRNMEYIYWRETRNALANTINSQMQKMTLSYRDSLRKDLDVKSLMINKEKIHQQLERRIIAKKNSEILWIYNARINRLLEERGELCRFFGRSPNVDKFKLDKQNFTTANSLVGNLIVPRILIGHRRPVWPIYCPTCSGVINYGKVYPRLYMWLRFFKDYEMAAGCSCR